MTLTVTDLSVPAYQGPGTGISDTCGLCRKTFDLMYEPGQYPRLANDMDEPGELICDACQDEVDAERPDPLAPLRAAATAAGITATSPGQLDDEGERLARQERQN